MAKTKRMHIQFNKLGEGKMECHDFGVFQCLGKQNLKYPRDLTINPALPFVKKHPYFSKEYVCDYPSIGKVNVPCRMNYSVLIWGQRGIYIHEWPNPPTFSGNGGPTGGCIHLKLGDAKKVYDWIDIKTRLTIFYPWK